jgi:signal transduction histidine kinase
MEKRYLRKDGVTAWVNVNMTLIRDAAGGPFRTLATIEDITERKRLEHERWAMEAQLRQQQKLESIGTLAGGVAHEINNPINGIMNYAQLIQDRLEPGSPLIEYTGEILQETHRVADIVRNLLTFAGNEKESHSPARIQDIVEGTLSLMRTVIRHDQITLRVDIPADLPNLKCRSQQLQQVLMNLMTNARDALNERYPGHDPDKLLCVEARLIENQAQRWIRLTVEDHGTGITPEVRERMFDPFFTTKPRDKGTGLGLAISHSIIQEHQGAVVVESKPGRFTRMHVDLPVDNGSQA